MKKLSWYGLATLGLCLGLNLCFGNNALGQSSPDDSINELLFAAQRGNVDAQVELGARYLQGVGVPQDYEQTVKYFTLAAQQGYAVAQLYLGDMCANGKGIKQDYKQAKYWYEKAAKQNNADAQYELGMLYAQGYGVKQSLETALEMFSRSWALGSQNGCNVFNETKQIQSNTPKDQYIKQLEQELQEARQLILNTNKTQDILDLDR